MKKKKKKRALAREGKDTFMKNQDINIRDPFVFCEGGVYYMYGTRAANFGIATGGFDVYVSTDLENWSDPIPCCDTVAAGLNFAANWAPEVHKVGDAYYMFATFTREDCKMRGTFALKADNPKGPFLRHTDVLTPVDWECLDGTLYVAKDGTPYLVFCHEHTQIIDGTVCYVQLSEDLSRPVGEAVTLFRASEPYWADETEPDVHRVTDAPFFYRTKTGELIMTWSTFVGGKYAVVAVRFKDGEIGTEFEHIDPIFRDDGGHCMIFKGLDGKEYMTFHTPNTPGSERPTFRLVTDLGDHIEVEGRA